MVTYKENDKYKFVYKDNKGVAVLVKEDNRIEFCDCVLTAEELKAIAEFILL